MGMCSSVVRLVQLAVSVAAVRGPTPPCRPIPAPPGHVTRRWAPYYQLAPDGCLPLLTLPGGHPVDHPTLCHCSRWYGRSRDQPDPVTNKNHGRLRYSSSMTICGILRVSIPYHVRVVVVLVYFCRDSFIGNVYGKIMVIFKVWSSILFGLFFSRNWVIFLSSIP